jgi:hypothetical protein
MTISARSGRCSRRGRGRLSGPSIDRASFASSISGSRASRFRSVTANVAAAGSSSRVWGYSRAAPARWCSLSRRGICFGHRALSLDAGQVGGVLVWDRPAGLHTRDRRPTDELAAFCGQLGVGWRFCEPADQKAKGAVERVQGCLETNVAPGRRFANERDYQHQIDGWVVKANARTHKTLRAPGRPAQSRARGDGCPARVSGSGSALGDPGPRRL